MLYGHVVVRTQHLDSLPRLSEPGEQPADADADAGIPHHGYRVIRSIKRLTLFPDRTIRQDASITYTGMALEHILQLFDRARTPFVIDRDDARLAEPRSIALCDRTRIYIEDSQPTPPWPSPSSTLSDCPDPPGPSMLNKSVASSYKITSNNVQHVDTLAKSIQAVLPGIVNKLWIRLSLTEENLGRDFVSTFQAFWSHHPQAVQRDEDRLHRDAERSLV